MSDEAYTKLAQAISQISGVGQVSVGGQQTPSIRVQIDPAKLVAKGLSLEDVRTPLSVITVNNPKGTLNGDTRTYTVYANDQFTNADAWNDIVIAYRNGSPVRVGDIGHAVSAPLDNTQYGWANGKPGVFLVIFKQPGANVIDTVDSVMKQLPHLKAGISPAIDISVISDRTQTIRAAVKDVQFTLLLTIGLVVMVIFVFLRSVWATIIPSITVPLALLGACALMWIAGYSLDNLSLMALTIAVGFVVDDAIVMLENITRYIEEGEDADGRRDQGRERNRVHHHLDFHFADRGPDPAAADERHHRPPVPRVLGDSGDDDRGVGFCVADIDADDGVALPEIEPREHHGKIYMLSERMFQGLVDGYERGLDLVLRFRFITLMVFFATMALTVYLFVIIPKGFFPQQDTGLISGIVETSQDVSIADMAKHMQEIGAIVLKDPAIDHMAMRMGGSGNTLNDGTMYITLKPLDQRTASADQVIRRLQVQTSKVEGARLYLQSAQDVRVGGRSSRTQYQFTLQATDLDQLNTWAPKLLGKMKAMPELRDVASDQQTSGTTLTLSIDRNQAARFGLTPDIIDATLYDAFGQREIATYSTQLSTYYVVLEVLPSLQKNPSTLEQIYLHSPTTGGEVPLSAFHEVDHGSGPAAGHQPPGPISGGDDLLQPGAQRCARPGNGCDRGDGKADECAGGHHLHVPGDGESVPGLALLGSAADRGGADRGLSHSRRAL